MSRSRPLALAAGLVLLLGCGGDARPAHDAADGGEGTPSATADAQASSAPAPSSAGASLRDPVPLTIDATIGGRRYQARGMGECTHTPEASIYDVRASQWAARYEGEDGGDGLEYLNMTVWQPKAGGEKTVTLGARAGGADHRISTTKGGQMQGRATVQAPADGAAGPLTVDGRAEGGADVRVTVTCERFTVPVAEGG